MSTECASGVCADGVCCQGACNTKCYACAKAYTGVADGTCAPVTNNTTHASDCAATAQTSCGTTGKCNGAGACQFWTGTCAPQTCTTTTLSTATSSCNGSGTCVAGAQTACGNYLCNGSTGACRSTCGGDTDCSTGNYCTSGSCGKKPEGALCGAASECITNSCGGRCCHAGASCTCPQPSSYNAVKDAGFDTASSLTTSWKVNLPAGEPQTVTWDQYSDASLCPYSGSAKIHIDVSTGFYDAPTITQCLTVTASTNYELGMQSTSTNNIGVCQIANFYSGAGCTGSTIAGDSFQAEGDGWGGPWFIADGMTPAGAQSALISCTASDPIGATSLDTWIDEVYFSPNGGAY
jgi:hypothetical protein